MEREFFSSSHGLVISLIIMMPFPLTLDTDAIYDQAQATRDLYCASLLSTASALRTMGERAAATMMPVGIQANPPLGQPPMAQLSQTLQGGPVMGQSPMDWPAQTANTGPSLNQPAQTEAVGPAEESRAGGKREPPMGGCAIPSDAKVKENGVDEALLASQVVKEPKEKKQQPPDPDQYESVGAGDALVNFVFFLVSTVFSLFFSLLIRLPLRIFTTMFVMLTVCTLAVLLWLYLADDNGAMSMGAGIDYRFNIPGVF